jgi:hypothetical protein
MKNRVISSIALTILLVGCDSQQAGVVTPAAPTPVAPASPHNHIRTVPTEIRDTFQSVALEYVVTPTSDGTLVGRLTWNPLVSGAKLMLTLEKTAFEAQPPEWSPVVGHVPVVTGRTYRIRVEEGVSPWDYHFNDSFVLTLSLE